MTGDGGRTMPENAGKDPDARKDWGQKETWTTEDGRVGWHYRLDGHEFEQAPGVGDGQGGLACCNPWGHKESDTTKRLNNNSKPENVLGNQAAKRMVRGKFQLSTTEGNLRHRSPQTTGHSDPLH